MFYVSCMLVRESITGYPADSRIQKPEDLYRIATEVLNLDKASEEYAYAIHVDTKNKVIGVHEISHGNLNTSVVHPREVFKTALLNNAYAIFLIHNHVSGDMTPSKDDISLTTKLKEAGEMLGIMLLDHIIVSNTGFLSIKEEGIL